MTKGWIHAIANADFTRILATVYPNGQIWQSTNSGTSFSVLSGSPVSKDLLSLAANGDFTKFIVSTGGSDNVLYKSTDDGVSWIEMTSAGFRAWYGVAVSSDFINMVAVTSTYIHASRNGGDLWFQLSAAGSMDWRNMVATPDLSKIVVAVKNDKVYHSLYDGPLSTTTAMVGSGTMTQLSLSGASGTTNCPVGSSSLSSNTGCAFCSAGKYSQVSSATATSTATGSCTSVPSGSYPTKTATYSSSALSADWGFAGMSMSSLILILNRYCSILVLSCFMWSCALDRSGVLLS